MNKILLVAFAFLCIGAKAQTTFQVKLNGNGSEEAVGVVELANGHFVVLSSKYVSGINMDMIISEVDGNGALIKSKSLGTTNGELAKAICKTSDGNLIIAGSYYTSINDYDLLVAKIDTGFNTLWLKHLGVAGGNDYVNSVCEIIPGRYGVTGTTAIGGSARPSFMILDDIGSTVKEFHLNTNQFASPNYKAVYLNNGTFAFCNLTNSLCIVDTAGNIIKNNATNFGIYTTDAMLSSGSRPTLLAYSDYGSLQGGTSSFTTFDSLGNTVVSSKKFKVSGSDLVPVKILPSGDGGYIIAANGSSLSNGYYTGILFKADSTGLLQWAKKYTPTGSQGSKINDLKRTADGGFIAVGSDGGVSTSILITKIDSMGFVQCNTTGVTMSTQNVTSNSSTTHSIASGITPVLIAPNPTLTTINTGITTLCAPVGINELNNSTSETLYPNPANSFISSSLKINVLAYTTIYSIDGKIVLQRFGNTETAINITALPAGLYMFEVKDTNGKVLQHSKFIKE